ncbi:Membrane protein involved in the export of O-antigen and teichoic acid [Micromonospora auratinigra]|uniref:Membrane protein involved in the export of O-antigen and teichoic acid n=2 Tax=Micromonospora auratinigra TaxID=261654 RepID=A0A1A9A947_9ACTN|nr:Membrane protein involved in the export of O-antigen and teichoic acid [Micromonospora auratinigra]
MRRHTAVLLAGQIGRIALQGLYFVVLARTLGAAHYGASAAVLALVSMLLPFSSLGTILLLVRNVAQQPATAAVQWANCVTLVLVSGTTLAVLLALAGRWVAPAATSVAVIAAVGITDLVLARVTEAAGAVFHAQEHMHWSALVPVLLQAARLLGLAALVLGPWTVDLTSWAVSYAVSTALVCLALTVLVLRRLGWSPPQLARYRQEWRTGLLFSVGMASTTVYNDVDKAMLGRFATLEATGIYSAAYRVVDMSYAPVRSLLGAASPAMWRAGADGSVTAVAAVARARLLRPAAAYCLLGTVGMFGAADLVPALLGDSFTESVPALRALSFLLIVKGCHYVIGDTLTCAGAQGARTVVQVAVAVLNVGLCLLLIPTHGWQGAVLVSLVCDGLLAVGLGAILAHRLRRERSRPAPTTVDYAGTTAAS